MWAKVLTIAVRFGAARNSHARDELFAIRFIIVTNKFSSIELFFYFVAFVSLGIWVMEVPSACSFAYGFAFNKSFLCAIGQK